MGKFSINCLLIILIASGFSCNKKESPEHDVLLRSGENVLTLDEVVMMIPAGLPAEDSVAFFNSIVEGWIRDMVLADFAEERLINTYDIDRRVKDYRNSLIVSQYLDKMKESQNPGVDEKELKDYYDAHRSEMKLEVPLIKGIFLKVNSETPRKEELKGLMTSDQGDKIDRMEREWFDKALEYNYFRDKWVDWTTVTGLIPYRFGEAEKFLAENNFFETESNGCTYYLYIADTMMPGEEQPYEYAREWISQFLMRENLADYERSLVTSLVKKSVKDGKLEAIGYDPVGHTIIDNKSKR